MTIHDDTAFLLSIFLVEAWETVAALESGLPRLDAPSEVAAEVVESLGIVAHRLKGAASLHGFSRVAALAGAIEERLDAWGSFDDATRRDGCAWLSKTTATIGTMLDRLGAGLGEEGDLDASDTSATAPVTTVGIAAEPVTAAVETEPSAPDMVRRFLAEHPEVAAFFLPEAAEHLDAISRALADLDTMSGSADAVAALFRAVHTLKGAAFTVGCAPVGQAAHRLEDTLVAVREGRLAPTPSVVAEITEVVDRLRTLLPLDDRPAASPAPAPSAALPVEPATPAVSAAPVPLSVAPKVAAAERGPVAQSIRVRLDRLDALMTVAGELVITRSRLDRRLEELDRAAALLLGNRSRLTEAVRGFETRYLDPRLPAAPLRNGVHGVFDELEFDRYDDFNVLARRLGEISADVAEVQSQVVGLVRAVREDAGRLQRLTAELRADIARARLVPVATLFARARRQAREAARVAGRAVTLEVVGEDVEVDTAIVEQLIDPLLHLIQNAVVHGIEPPEDRAAAGKPVQGTIRISATHRGGFVVVTVEDDGVGIDVEAVRREAVHHGLLPPETAATASDHDVAALAFAPGISTRAAATPTAGRGVGLDVVQTNVRRLNGTVSVDTRRGHGARFTLTLPVRVVVSDALVVRAGSECYAVALPAVSTVVRIASDEIEREGEEEIAQVEGRAHRIVRLERALGLPPTASRGPRPALLLRGAARPTALLVDALVGKDEIVVKPLGEFLAPAGPYAGATISPEGRVMLLLDPAALAAGVTAAPAARPPRPAPSTAAGPRALLVDDSISVRKFVGAMLQRAGFAVLTAGDGAEALDVLARSTVDVLVTDLEMPRVNGYELIEELRRRPATRELPVVVLTTRAGERHVAVARGLGVEHYATKPVDERGFVRLVSTAASAPALVEA